MSHKIIVAVLGMLVVIDWFASGELAQAADPTTVVALPAMENPLGVADYFAGQSLVVYQNAAVFDSDQPPLPGTKDVYAVQSKSPGKAFLFSFLLPGLGQNYSESKIKRFIFPAIEVGLWAGWFALRSHGFDKRREYQSFADTHWDRNRYYDSLRVTYNCGLGYNDDTQPCYYNPQDSTRFFYFTHHLPATKNIEYYENIGKYEQFRGGWDDPPNRTAYLEMRFLSNRAFDRAKALAITSLGNHLLSAIDAAVSANKFNKKADRLSQVKFQMRLAAEGNEVVPHVRMAYNF